MSKIKSDVIKKIYEDNYLCKNGHNIKWTGNSYIFSSDLNCEKCGIKSGLKNPIRWNCSQCKTYYCSNCYDIIIDKICPMNHKLVFQKQKSVYTSETFTCDKCIKSLYHNNGVLYDQICNLTICPTCYYDSCDVPEILED